MNQILLTLKHSIYADAKILQLTGNMKIINFLKLIATKLSKGLSLM